MKPGYGGRILRINLTEGKVSKEPTPDDLIKDYLGARGFIIRTLYEELAPGTDPLGPDAMFLTAAGPLTGLFRGAFPCGTEARRLRHDSARGPV